MNTRTIGFVGGGRVTRIILEGLQHAPTGLRHIVVSDSQTAPLEKLKARFPDITVALGDNARAAGQEIVFLAVHPPALGEVAGQIKEALRPDAIVISLAPKFTLARLSASLGGFQRTVRVIPNAPSMLGLGFNPIAFGAALSPVDRAAVNSLLAPLGECPEVDETKLEGYALLTAMGPTYLWFQLQTLRELAVEFGLTEAEAAPALKRMVCGSTRTLLESGLSATEVMDLVPVKPLGDLEAGLIEAYRSRLGAVHQKLKP